MQDVKTVAKEEIIKRTAIKVNERPQIIKRVVSEIFTALRVGLINYIRA